MLLLYLRLQICYEMKACKLFFIFCICFLSSSNNWAQSSVEPPKISAEGDQLYCPLSELNVVTDFNISGPEDLVIDAFFIQITSGYVSGDLLKLNSNSTSLIPNWNLLTGKLTLSKSGQPLTYAEINEAVKNVVYVGNNADYSGEKFFSFTLGDANFLPSTGHFYEFVPAMNIRWDTARDLAEEKTYFGLPGYLATITSQEEAVLSGEQATGTGWIGASDAEVEGTWKWVTGPEAGTTFWVGNFDGSAPNGAYENWNANEPNNVGAGGEDYGHVITNPRIGPRGSWNDLPITGGGGDFAAQGYVVEYGYGGPDDAPDFTAFTKIYTNKIDNVSSSNRCGPGSIELSATVTEFEDQPIASQVLWFDSLESNTPIWTGESYTPDLSESKDFYVLASDGTCTEGQRKLVSASIYEIPDIVKEVSLKNCDADDIPNDGFTDFNLEDANDEINKGDLTLSITYYINEQDAINDNDPIDPPFFNNSISDQVFARAVNLDNCFDIAKVNLEVSATNPLDVLALLESCDEDDINDGKFTFDLTDASVIILESLPQQDLQIQYYRNQEDAALKINEILPQSAYMNEIAYEQQLFVRIESLSNGECVSVGEYVRLKVNPLPEFEVPVGAIYCQNLEPITLSVSQAQDVYTYEWKDENGTIISTRETVEIVSGGTYTVTGTSALNCVSKVRILEVEESSIASISQDDIEVVDGGEINSIQIDTSNLGIGDYEYALDSQFGPYQEDPFFDGVLPGIHTLYIRDQNGCGIEQIKVSVIGYPKFFTPNGDGYNDTWQVQGVSFQPKSNIYIYNKFGTLLAQLDARDEEGWFGTYKGRQLPSSDYWYRVELEDGRVHTGHFSLIRR